MCGIAGVYAFSGGTVEPRERCQMTDRLVHRGPDDAGFLLVDERGAAHFGRQFRSSDYPSERAAFLGFGHRRLSIIDIAGGHQPMADASGQVWLSFNGEIY